MLIDRAFGIDLGTTNSEIALLPPSEKDILLYTDKFGRKTFPSAVGWDEKKGAFVVGRDARNQRAKLPIIESVKRKMGQKVLLPLGPHQLSPEQVSAAILKELALRMGETLAGETPFGGTYKIGRAAVTVPAYFDAPQLGATRAAVELAGLSLVGLLQEPTAAAMYHAWKHKLSDGNFLVYDLGGGTFDVSIVRSLAGEYQVLAIDGDNYLGGDDFDRAFAERLRRELAGRGYKLDLNIKDVPEDRAIFQKLVHLAQEIKESLSTTEVLSVSKEGFALDQVGEPLSIEMEVPRSLYEGVIGPLVETTIESARRALLRSESIAGVGLSAIDHVILVGGSTRVPLVVRRVTEALSKASKNPSPLAEDVDTSVALGAAIFAAQRGGTILRTGKGEMRWASSFAVSGKKWRGAIEPPADGALLGDEAIVSLQGEEIHRAQNLASGVRWSVDVPEEETKSGSLEGDVTYLSKGAEVARFPFEVVRNVSKPRGSSLSRATVLAKDISIELSRAGARTRKVLLSAGTGLPTSAQYEFFTGDQSGVVVLRLLQNRLPIESIAVKVSPDLPVGTTVDLALTCDESMQISATARVGENEVRAEVRSLATEAFDAPVDKLLEEAELAQKSLWGSRADWFKHDAERLTLSIRETVRTDPDKLNALCLRLRDLLDDARGGPADDLSPPKATMDAEMRALRQIVFRSEGTLMGRSKDEWEIKLDSLQKRMDEAYETRAATEWRRLHNELQALRETASQEDYAKARVDDVSHLRSRCDRTILWASRLRQEIQECTISSVIDLGDLQRKEQARLLEWVTRIERELGKTRETAATMEAPKIVPVRQRLEGFESELERVALGLERLPLLGLVRERVQ